MVPPDELPAPSGSHGDTAPHAVTGGRPAIGGRRPTRAVAWLVLPPSILLAPLSAFLLYMVHTTGSDQPFHTWNLLWTALDIGAEGNASVWFASTVWLLVGTLAALAAVTAPRFRKSWWLFAAVGVTASADEAAALHERLFVVGDRLAPYLPLDTFYNWVIPGAVIALVVGALLIRLILALRPRVAGALIASGALFLLGALVVETLSGLVHREDQGMSPLYLTLMYVEETFELVAVATAAIALSSMFRVARSAGSLTVTFDGFRATDAGTPTG